MQAIIKRPLAVTIIAWIFVAAGAIGFAYHVTEFKAGGAFQYDVLWVCLVRVMAIIAGVFLLRGSNWSRWLSVVWLAYHVILSVFHSVSGVIMHTLLLAVIAYFLFGAEASAYLKARARQSPSE